MPLSRLSTPEGVYPVDVEEKVEEERVSATITLVRNSESSAISKRKSWPDSGVQIRSGVVLPLRLWPLRFHTAVPALGASRLGGEGAAPLAQR